MAYVPPVDDLAFVLHDVLELERSGLPGAADLDRETTAAILGEAGRLAAEVLAPLNAVGDREGCRLENGVVVTATGFLAAWAALKAGGWTSLDADPAHGGQGMPHVVQTAVGEMFTAANMAFQMFAGLSHGAAGAIAAHGTAATKALYLPRLVAGDWTGTMQLTEPQCGTDLGLIATRAEPAADGSWRLSGTKIFISAGDHDLAENIVHLVLARTPGGGPGTRGLSLFIVPKFLPDALGRPGARNALAAVRLEHKMGIHASPTCEMRLDGATGWLVGERHKGMPAMFTMMNAARLWVGLQGLGQAVAAGQAAAGYARERLQGRAVRGPANPGGPADPLIVHPDVRRTLMDIRAFVEGARALALWTALLIDRDRAGTDPAAEGLVALMVPVVKGFLTDRSFAACVAAQQVWGGHGYIEDNGLAQFVRDARVAMIYEGANGIQALDLVGRKLPAEGGRHVLAFLALAKAAAAAAEPDFGAPLAAAAADLEAALAVLAAAGAKDPDDALAGATDFLHLMGHVALGLMWARIATAARAGLAAGRGERAFLEAKLVTGRHWMAREMPATALHLARIRAGGGTVMALAADAF
ncbi:MAG: acyl-CoA dehydrogenase C-terminal domain-containing protein [Rhodobacteraceae bacterium]|nr:acyl-CoA dehydrogenase C-terminal domain-containing protein [Paracoccaceae bacterium]